VQEGGDAMSEEGGQKPVAVPAMATRAGEALKPPGQRTNRDWAWAEPPIWTERMLATLERGVKGGKCNAFFVEHRLFSLQDAYELARQSSRR
jgi:hypothetical protein